MNVDVVIAGAGPVGLALACALRQHGASVRVVDKASGPAATSRANFVHARGSEVLDRLDALGRLPDEAVRAMTITTYAGDRPMARIRFGDTGLHTAAPPMVISQARVEAELRERLAALGGRAEWSAAVVAAEQDASGVTVTLDDGRTMRAGWLVGCDGTSSTVRKLAGIGFPGVKVSERFLIVDAQLDTTLDRSGSSGWVHPAGLVGIMPMPGDLWRLLAYDPTFREDKPSQDMIIERMRRILPERTGLTDLRLRDAQWASLFRVHRRLADAYRQGRILLAGDAAHAHAPFGGQGMLTGLGDAENLAWKLALVIQGQAGERLLDTYQAERRPLAVNVLRGSTAATKVNIADGPFGRFVRDRVLLPVAGIPWIQRRATFTASQLWVSYRSGPLGGRGVRPRPGDRIPDLDCRRADGIPTRLHAELRGRWAVLGDDSAIAAARRRLNDAVVALSPPDTSTPAMLVRPDAHLAAKGDAMALARWLDRALT